MKMLGEIELLCWACGHLSVTEGEPDYSELTPGRDPEIACDRGHFDTDDALCSRQGLRACMLRAQTCEDFIPFGMRSLVDPPDESGSYQVLLPPGELRTESYDPDVAREMRGDPSRFSENPLTFGWSNRRQIENATHWRFPEES